jgi:hypothetical protein
MNASPDHATLDRPVRNPAIGARRMLDTIIAIYGDKVRDNGMEERAIEAFVAGRPAFYTSASYHNARALCLCDTANETGDICAALRTEYRYADSFRATGLNALIPLNDLAAAELVAAYSSIGTMVEIDELVARRMRKAVL